jgi:hypothetical protein
MRNKEAEHILSEINDETYARVKHQDLLSVRYFHCEGGARRLEVGQSGIYFSEHVPQNGNAPAIISGPHPIPCAEFATMRQIGWEVELALGSTLAVLKVNED